MDELFEQVSNIKDDASRLKLLYKVIGGWVRKPLDTLDSIHQTADNTKNVTAHGRLLIGKTTLDPGNLTSVIDHLNGTLEQTHLLFQFTFLGISGGVGLTAATDGCLGNYVSGATYLAGSCCHFGSVSASAGITQIRKCITPISKIINPQEPEET